MEESNRFILVETEKAGSELTLSLIVPSISIAIRETSCSQLKGRKVQPTIKTI